VRRSAAQWIFALEEAGKIPRKKKTGGAEDGVPERALLKSGPVSPADLVW
jgi:hypothetical protein